MKRLVIKSLSILSKDKNKGNAFVFIDGINFIKSKNNSAGKTTLLNLMYSTLGCKVKFKDEWEDVYTRLDIIISDKEISLYKTPNGIFYTSIDNKVKKYESDSDFHYNLQKLLGYEIYLKTHKGELKIARPAHFLSTSYISQTNGWGSFFAPSLDGLGEFKDYKKDLVEQFTTIKSCTELRNNIELKEVKDELNHKSIELNILSSTRKNLITNDTLNDETVNSKFQLNLNSIQELSERYEQEIGGLQEELSTLAVERRFLLNEIQFNECASKEIEQDYLEARKNGSIIECPYCGTIHNNTVTEKSELFSLKAKLENDVTYKEQSLKNIDAQIVEIKAKIGNLSELKGEITNQITQNIVLLKKSIASSEISTVIEDISNYISNLNIKIKEIKKSIRDSKKNYKNHSEAVNEFFLAKLKNYADSLSLTFSDYNKINKVTNYNDIVKQVKGGDADTNRSVLAYYLAIYQTAINFNTLALPPLVIDTPNQNDQDPENYHAIITTLLKEKNKQIFVCLVSDDSKKDNWEDVNQIEVERLLKSDKANTDLFSLIW